MARHAGTLIPVALVVALAPGCGVADQAILRACTAAQAGTASGAGVAPERVDSSPSRPGSLFGGCLHAGALQA
ncbi:hypothetical protein [Coralloluteibacterium stylophorae]|uniref:Uncharacterized protein n=1 Tax=Coralloluteibacterium stylophorae TaxID=1776034 RepID=A0A8J7VS65_9GAMM|nr:hypothetical protein [Coralloluteibacterium stylophorae]MBS7455894.1 hypothetical protein [Coralloluteibacterium stylophorae]